MNLATPGANTVCDAFVDSLDGGSIMFHTSGDAEVAKCTMNTPAFGASASGVATMVTSPDVEDANTTAGTIAHAHFLNSGDTIQSQMTCGTGAEEFVFSSLVFANGETLKITSLTVTWTPTAMT